MFSIKSQTFKLILLLLTIIKWKQTVYKFKNRDMEHMCVHTHIHIVSEMNTNTFQSSEQKTKTVKTCFHIQICYNKINRWWIESIDEWDYIETKVTSKCKTFIYNECYYLINRDSHIHTRSLTTELIFGRH